MIHIYDHRADILAAEDSDPGVYYLLNTMSLRMRIGQSVHVFQRLITHYGQLRAGSHTNTALQEDWNTFGEYNFEFGVLVTIPCPFHLGDDERHLRELETHFMKLYRTKDPIYGYDFDQRKPNTKTRGKVYEGFFAHAERMADLTIQRTLGKAAHL